MKLISMTSFVLEQSKKIMDCELTHLESYGKIVDYANFLNKPLKLEMFVPCDEDGNFLTKSTMSEDTCEDDCNHKSCVSEMNECIKYQKAKEKVLFEGFEVCNRTTKIDCVVYNEDHITLILLKDKTIEYLINRNLTLTPNAIKQLGL